MCSLSVLSLCTTSESLLRFSVFCTFPLKLSIRESIDISCPIPNIAFGLLIRPAPGTLSCRGFTLGVCGVLHDVEDLSQGQIVRKRLMRTSKLTELRPIIEKLEGFIEPNDLVVLCPAAILHALPLHAIPFGTEGKPLIISNPVVYSASNALLWRCVSKAHQMAFHDTNDFRAATFTGLGPHDPREEMRMKKAAQAVMKYFEKSTLTYGRLLTREGLMEEARYNLTFLWLMFNVPAHL
jgi:hypothetical protein